MRRVTVIALIFAAAALAACSRAPGDYYDQPPGQVMVQLESMDLSDSGKAGGVVESWRDGDTLHWTLTLMKSKIAAFHAILTADCTGTRVVLADDPVDPPGKSNLATGLASYDKAMADTHALLGTRFNRRLMGDMLREKIASTLLHRPMDPSRSMWNAAAQIARDASLISEFGDRVDELQTDAAKAAFDAQKSESDMQDRMHSSGGSDTRSDYLREYRPREGLTGRPTPGAGQPTLDTRPRNF